MQMIIIVGVSVPASEGWLIAIRGGWSKDLLGLGAERRLQCEVLRGCCWEKATGTTLWGTLMPEKHPINHIRILRLEVAPPLEL